MNLQFKRFDQLTTQELYQIVVLRQNGNQQCPKHLSIDSREEDCTHVFITDDQSDQIICYLRIRLIDKDGTKASLDRIVTHPDFRKQGYAKEIMKGAVSYISSQYGYTMPIAVSAPRFLEKFFYMIGFHSEGLPYRKDDLEMIKMLYLCPVAEHLAS